jgi:hypothetical protein
MHRSNLVWVGRLGALTIYVNDVEKCSAFLMEEGFAFFTLRTAKVKV